MLPGGGLAKSSEQERGPQVKLSDRLISDLKQFLAGQMLVPCCIWISRTDFSPMGSRGFGMASVKGFSLVPNPPANITAFKFLLPCYIF